MEPLVQPVYQSQPKLNSKLLIIVISLVVFAGAGAAYFLIYPDFLNTRNQTTNTKPDLSSPQPSSLIKNQSATVYGKVVEKNSNFIKVLGENGEAGQFKLAPSILIYKQSLSLRDKQSLSLRDRVATNSANTETFAGIDQIELEKEAVIVLNMFDGEYKVTSVSYVRLPLPNKQAR